ncbi:uncharacterized protein BDCG_17258 [Blastomyces dermatitidis ER-3]|uniref:Uncharacterized protein n=1 Tax=Ajellomyces dermatitidis (strain ER-3 / ATCC MYA-2586) TaxID=559297 RepID=A0ABX2VXI2_AJEDR|nr:uncharacterized protein BDCG_17258 [Blastomyces dermatitidis ER-3]OAT01854.1 hypothetical protein BDCG_17258 [Blastomyces dermatitidis ER-3]
MDRVFAEIASQISPQLQIGDLPKSRRLAHMAMSLHLTICMALWPGVVVWKGWMGDNPTRELRTTSSPRLAGYLHHHTGYAVGDGVKMLV